ncbi:malate dehydrogenase [Richelia sinica FACHB-800]|uniref:Malate dehydrogenase n=1 Tax=Richelia sinica FACHB-800 TaxID=1357546 RepID=A0A975T9K4_9NOST|nr:malate dehydrogenase [Richelia sinica FACHB-800]
MPSDQSLGLNHRGIMVTSNPLDVMTYLALQATGLPRQRVMGMAGL